MKDIKSKFKATEIVSLVGFMGSGKSSVGFSLAKKLGLKFLDSDQLLTERLGISIKEFFEKFGEFAFREEETKLLKLVMEERSFILSTGGGAYISEENRIVLSKGITVYLDTSFDVLMKRLSFDTTRPLLKKSREDIYQLFQIREFSYQRADLQIKTNDLKIHRIANRIIKELK